MVYYVCAKTVPDSTKLCLIKGPKSTFPRRACLRTPLVCHMLCTRIHTCPLIIHAMSFYPPRPLALSPGSLLKNGRRREPGNIREKSCWLPARHHSLFTISLIILKASAALLSSMTHFVHVNSELRSMVRESVPQTSYSKLWSWTLWSCAPSAHPKLFLSTFEV